jgi:hypothetical protein
MSGHLSWTQRRCKYTEEGNLDMGILFAAKSASVPLANRPVGEMPFAMPPCSLLAGRSVSLS